MVRRMSVMVVCALVLVAVGGFGQLAAASQAPPAVWNSTAIWQPTLGDAGNALSELVNQIDAACSVDVDNIVVSGGSGPEGSVYAFVVTWACPPGLPEVPVSTWNSAMIWQPTLGASGDALSELVNQIDAACHVDVDNVVASGGQGPEGPVYAFLVTWACPDAVGA